MPVADWFNPWFFSHIARHPIDWPSSIEFIEAWKAAFITRGVNEPVATAASVELVATSPRFANEHLPALIVIIERLWKEKKFLRLGAATGSIDEARLLSVDCPDCGGGTGGGMTIRFRRISAANATASGQPVDPYLWFFCTCALGRYLFDANYKAAKSTGDKIALEQRDLSRKPFLQLGPVHWTDRPDNSYRYDPALWDSVNNRPIGAHVDFDSIRRSLADLLQTPRGPRRRQPREAPEFVEVQPRESFENVAMASARYEEPLPF